jgi:hypothetical protein
LDDEALANELVRIVRVSASLLSVASVGAGSGAMLGAAAAALESDWIRAMVAERGSTYCEFMMPGSKTREEKFSKKASPTALIAGRGFFLSCI